MLVNCLEWLFLMNPFFKTNPIPMEVDAAKPKMKWDGFVESSHTWFLSPWEAEDPSQKAEGIFQPVTKKLAIHPSNEYHYDAAIISVQVRNQQIGLIPTVTLRRQRDVISHNIVHKCIGRYV